MGVDQTSLDRIRNATFPAARRGYDKHEVEKFLSRLADWLETGAGDESRSDTVRRELQRVGERTGAILAQAEESAQQIRAEAQEEATAGVEKATQEAQEARTAAEAYAKETRSSADSYAEEKRQTAEREASATQTQAEQEARETIESAQAEARRIVDEGTQRRDDIEAVIADLVRRRDEVLGDTDELTRKLTAAVSEHRPAKDEDDFAPPEEYDPLARDDEDDEDADADPESEAEGDPEAEDDESRVQARP